MNRDESLRQLREARVWDVLVIGGGATGLGAALDAATRGYRTALVEQSDFAKATSSRSTKLIHGGVRYLRQGNLSLVRGALHERTRLLANAPNLVHPLAFVIPSGSLAQTLFYGAGLKLYDLLAGRHGLSASQILSKEEVLARAPTLGSTHLRGGLLYFDAQFDDSRLAIALAQTFAENGGALLNYARVVALRKSSGKICGALVHDEESGAEIELTARVVVNATGVFCDSLRKLDEPKADVSVTPSQGAHLVLPKRFLPGETAILLPSTSDGRVLFAIPWHDRVLLGTTDI
ncbi:MAG TPA: FAD-dependent oxidoreductase, partial [Chthoniobacteraceae bacterium]